MDRLGEVTLTIPNETPQAGIAGSGPSKAVPLQRPDREAENSCRFFDREGNPSRSAVPVIRRQNNNSVKFAGRSCQPCRLRISQVWVLGLISGFAAKVGEFFFVLDSPDIVSLTTT